MSVSNLDDLKRQAALKAADYIRNGMVVGLGTGSTAKHVILALGERIKKGLKIKGVPTSQETAKLARKAKIPLLSDDAVWPIDVAIDGADQVDQRLNLIKGGGGALLKEKIVAAASDELAIIIDEKKDVQMLGVFPLPVEVITFGWKHVQRRIESMYRIETRLREKEGKTFITDHKHYILDCFFKTIAGFCLNISFFIRQEFSYCFIEL